jgi:hypothetical protein
MLKERTRSGEYKIARVVDIWSVVEIPVGATEDF